MSWRAIPGDGKIYVQTGEGHYASVDFDGHTVEALSVKAVPGTTEMSIDDLHVIDISPDSRGGVLAPVVWERKTGKSKAGILKFDSRGSFSGLTWLDGDFFPTRVASFSSTGNMLVAGYDDDGKIPLSIFDTHGKLLIARISADPASTDSLDSKAKQDEAARDQATLEASQIQLASGDDDAVYLFDPTKGRKILRVTPNGKTTEIILTKSDSQGSEENLLPMNFFASRGSLYLHEAILKSGEKAGQSGQPVTLQHFAISVYDRYTGELRESYRIYGDFAGTVAAASPREFYFLKSKDIGAGALRFSLVRAAK
jgi:hypothetical protein